MAFLIGGLWISGEAAERKIVVSPNQVTLVILGTAAGDRTYASQSSWTTGANGVSPPPNREPTVRAGRHRPGREGDTEGLTATRSGSAPSALVVCAS
jgi:hypothetical protein